MTPAVTSSSLTSGFVPSYYSAPPTSPSRSAQNQSDAPNDDFSQTFRDHLAGQEDSTARSQINTQSTAKVSTPVSFPGKSAAGIPDRSASVANEQPEASDNTGSLSQTPPPTGQQNSKDNNSASLTAAVAVQPSAVQPLNLNLINPSPASNASLPPVAVNAKSDNSAQRQGGNSTTSTTSKPEARKSSSHNRTDSDTSGLDVIQLSSAGQQAIAASASAGERNTDESPEETEEANVGKSSELNQADPVSSTSSQNPVSGELAIAMHITSPGSDIGLGDTQANTDSVLTAPGANVIHGQLEAGASTGSAQPHEPVSALSMASAVEPQAANATQTDAPEKTEDAGKPQPADFETALNKAQSEPVRGAHVQITGADDQRVDIRLQERGGVMSVTVRSADNGLTRALQDHTPELTARLSTEHFQTELWTPNSSKASQQFTNNNGGNSQNQQGASSGQQQPNQRQNGKQNQHPEWIDEFENNPTAFNKRIEYSWHQ